MFDRQEILCELESLQDWMSNRILNGPPNDEAAVDAMAIIHSSNGLNLGNIQSTWGSLSRIDTDTEIRPATAHVLAALSLQCHSRMWAWFDEQVTNPTRHLAEIPVSTLQDVQSQMQMPNEWILPLCRLVRITLLVYQNVHLRAKEFFPWLDAPDYRAPPGNLCMPSRILKHVEGAVALWLGFGPRPGMGLQTSRAVATFISTVWSTFNSPDFLYLSSIQCGVKVLRSILTEEKIELTGIPWKKLAEELKNHPLASPESDEALALNHLKQARWSISNLPLPPHFPPEIPRGYKKAIEMGGEKGLDTLAQSTVPLRLM